MAAGILLIPGWTPAVDSDGAPIPNARAYYYLDETTTLAPIFADEGLTTPLTNPVEANSSGRWPIIWASDANTYTWSIEAPYGPPGLPFTGTGLTASQATDLIILDGVNAAADQADDAATAATDAYNDILALAASLPDTDPIVIAGKANVTGSNILGANQAAFRGAIGADLAANVNFIAGFTGAVSRPVQTRDRERVSAADGGAVSTININKATQSGDVASNALWKAVEVPNGVFTAGAANSTIFVRKGQSLVGKGFGATTFDLTGINANTVPVISLGKKSDGSVDAGGQPVDVRDMLFLGGPSGYANIDTTGVAGWKLANLFFSAPGIGIRAGGGDGLLHDSIFDLGLNQIIVANCGNTLISDNLFYLGNYQITVSTDSRDVTISNSQHEYFQYAGVFLADGATAINNVRIVGSNFIQADQYATTVGAIYFRSTGASVVIDSCAFRNIKGPAINYGTGTGNRMDVSGCVFDGLKTYTTYTQSTTMEGINASNISSVIRACSFRNLPGQPITLGGTEATTWIIDGCDFSGNTGGTTEINITNNNASSKVIIRNCQGSGRPLVNVQSTVPVVYENNDAGTGRVAITAVAVPSIPYGTQVVTWSAASVPVTTLPSGTVWRDKSIRFFSAVASCTFDHAANNIFCSGQVDLVMPIYTFVTFTNTDGANWVQSTPITATSIP